MNARPTSNQERFIGEDIVPEALTFSAPAMASGGPGLPRSFAWRGETYPVLRILEEWKETGPCRHGSGELYVRKHWFRFQTTGDLELRVYFERQPRPSSSKRRWRLFSLTAPSRR